MGKLNLVSFLSPEDTPDFEGIVHYKNPKWWEGNVPGFADFVVSDRPEIVKAFEEKGVKAYAVKRQHKESSDPVEPVEAGESLNVKTQEEGQRQKEEVEIPEDWESLPFFSQKSIASKLTEETVRTKDDVQRVIREHLE